MDRVSCDIQTVIANEKLFRRLEGASILVTGATGLIGSMLVKTLLAANDQYNCDIKVIGQIRNFDKAGRIFGKDVKNLALSASADVPCTHIIHTVSPTSSKYFIESPVETIKTSVGSAMEILEIAEKNHASLVYLSSMEQYGVPYQPGQHMTEDMIGIIDHLNIRSSYSESKRLCECLCASYAAEYGVDVKIARLAQTFGAGISLTDNRMPMQFAKAAAESRDIILHTKGESISNFVYLTDAVSGILTILVSGEKGQAYNVCNDSETRSVREIAELVCQSVADGKIAVRVEEKENMGYAPTVAMYLDSRKLRSLGWTAEIDMASAYARLVEYIKESMT